MPKLDMIESCCICFEEFNDDTIISQSLCEHIFHEDCIKIWFLTKLSSNIYISKEQFQKPDCPNCRTQI
jgi:hypothetical protein